MSLAPRMKVADLGTKSVRRNALIADLLHRIDFIEKAGTGVKRIRDEAREGGYPEPEWEASGFVTTIFRPNPEVRTKAEAQVAGDADQVTAHVPHMYRPSREQAALLEAAREPRSREELQEVAGIRHRQHFLLEYLRPLLEAGLLEMTIPDRPRSSKQCYLLTKGGRAYLAKNKEA